MMRPLRLILAFCGLTALATFYSAGGATGVIPVTDASPSVGSQIMAAGLRQPSPAPSLLDRTIRLTLRMAETAKESETWKKAISARPKFENSFRGQPTVADVTITHRGDWQAASSRAAASRPKLTIRPRPRAMTALR